MFRQCSDGLTPEATEMAPSRPLRVVSISIPYPGPRSPVFGVFVQRRLSALARLTDLSVINPQPWFPWAAPLAGGVQDSPEWQPPVSRPRMFYLPGVLKGLDGYWLKRCLVPLLKRLRASGPLDLIDAHFEYPEAVGCVMAARELGLPVFLTIRGILRQVVVSRVKKSLFLRALQHATGVISVAHALKRIAVEHGAEASKIRVIPNAVDAQVFCPGSRELSRRELAVEGSGPLIVSVGNILPGKQHHVLVQAFQRVAAERPGARLVIVGRTDNDPGYTQSLRRLITASGLEGRVTLTGSQLPRYVAQWLRAADVFALPSAAEGCCNAVLEALGCGVPVVVTPVGDNADFVEESGGGLLVPVGDPAALAEGIGACLDRAWDGAAIAAYTARRTWSRVAEETVGFFRERLAAVSGPGAGREQAYARRATGPASISRP